MTPTMLYAKISSLPPAMIKEVNDFVDFLKTKQKKEKIKERKFGCAKGLFVMHDDFDAPLEDSKENETIEEITPIVKSMMGSFKVPEDFDPEKAFVDGLNEKYSK